METTAKIKTILKKYLPEGTEDYIVSLFVSFSVSFKIVKPRSTKLGDFRVNGLEQPQITVNGDLNPYSFLVTTVHEFAHLKTWIEHGRSVKPHGNEWKKNFIELMYPVIQKNCLPKDIEQALLNSFMNVKASSCSDVQLNRVLKKYDVNETNGILLEQLPKNTIFVLNNKAFKKGELRRTRYMCTELTSGKQYLVYKLATVERIENEHI